MSDRDLVLEQARLDFQKLITPETAEGIINKYILILISKLTTAQARIKELEATVKMQHDEIFDWGRILLSKQQTITEQGELITAMKICDKAQEYKIDKQAAEIERLKAEALILEKSFYYERAK